MEGVVKPVPVPSAVPPLSVVYQLTVPYEAVAPNVTVPVPQLLPGVVVAMNGVGPMGAEANGTISPVESMVAAK